MALLFRSARTALFENRSSLPPTFLLPLRARLTTVSHTLDTSNVAEPLLQSGHQIAPDQRAKVQSPPQISQNAPQPTPSEHKPSPHARQDIVSSHITPSIRHMLPLLHAQPAHYATIHLHGRPYLVTRGDTIRLPFLMPHVRPGDVLRLNRATHIGSRDYTLKAPEAIKGNADHVKKVFYLDEKMFVCRARVVAIESEPMRVEEKTKRRQRHVKHVFSKHYFTVLRVSEFEVRSLEEYEGLLKG